MIFQLIPYRFWIICTIGVWPTVPVYKVLKHYNIQWKRSVIVCLLPWCSVTCLFFTSLPLSNTVKVNSNIHCTSPIILLLTSKQATSKLCVLNRNAVVLLQVLFMYLSHLCLSLVTQNPSKPPSPSLPPPAARLS